MTVHEAADQAQEFLDGYLIDNEYFTPQEDRENPDQEFHELRVLTLWMATGDDQTGHINLQFEYGGAVNLSKHDPKAKANQSVEALKKAYPEIAQFPIDIEVKKARPPRRL